MSSAGLDINSVRRLEQNFIDNKWNEIDTNNSIFDNFCKLLTFLEVNERDLIIELTNDYLWVRNNDYYALLINVLESLANVNLSLKKIYIMAMISPKDRLDKKNKSANRVAYDCMDFSIGAKIPYFENIDFHQLHNTDGDMPRPTKMSESIIVMVDDYIGSGQTALETLDALQLVKKYNKDKIFILSLVGQEDGLNKIRSAGYKNVFCSIVRKKGITDAYASPQRDEHLRVMEGIENRMDVKFDFKFGIGASEGLVSMLKTPNNTFPVFWLDSTAINKNLKAPFRRKN